jgi:hypothetical protein
LGAVFIYPKSFQFTSPNLQNVQNLSEAVENHLPAGNEQPATSNKQSVLLPFPAIQTVAELLLEGPSE